MGYTIFLALEARLQPNCPPSVLAYFETLATCQRGDVQDSIEITDRLGTLPDPGWFDGATVSRTHSDLLLTGAFNDDFVQHQYALLALIAKHTVDGTFGATWTDTDKTTATVCIANQGELFLSSGKPTLLAADSEKPPPVDAMVSSIPPGFFSAHGLPATAEKELRNSLATDPIAAKILLTRTLHREIKDVIDIEPDPDRLVERIVRQVVDVLDSGSDSRAAPDSPGWQLVEQQARYAGQASTGRIMTGLSDVLQHIDDAVAITEPLRLVVGMEIVMLADVTLQAHRRADDYIDLGSGATGTHVVTVDVPAGALLRIGWVAPRGHATAQSSEWPTWGLRQPSGRRVSVANPTKPLGDPNNYDLRFITLEDEGKLWRLA